MSTEETTPVLAWWKAALLSLGSGVLTALAFPPLDWGFLVWVGLLPLLTALWMGPARKWRGFVMGWLYGMGFYSTSFHWIVQVGPVWNIPVPLFLCIAFIPLMAFFSCAPGVWGLFAATLLRPALQPAPDTSKAKNQERKKEIWNAWLLADLCSTLRCAVGLGALWVCMEWVRTNGPLGCSWNSLGLALYDGLSLAQWAEFVGTLALSFLPVATCVMLWCVGRRVWIAFQGTRKICRPWDFYATIFLLFALFMGGLALSRTYSPANMYKRDSVLKLPVVAIQSNADQKERVDRTIHSTKREDHIQYNRELTDGYIAATGEAFEAIQYDTIKQAQENPGQAVQIMLPAWVVWPESAVGQQLFKDNETGLYLVPEMGDGKLRFPSLADYENGGGALTAYLQSLSTSNDGAYPAKERRFSPPDIIDLLYGLHVQREKSRLLGGRDFVLFTGADEFLYNPRQGTSHGARNSLVVFPPDLSQTTSAAKQHLMPFGEYIPLVQDIEWIGKVFAEVTGTAVGDGLTPGEGTDPIPVPVPGTKETVQVIPAICYEDTDGALLRKFARAEAQVIVNNSNDAWFQNSVCGLQQARAAAFRCIELRRPMVRAANRGLCCCIAPNGGIISALYNEDGDYHTAGYCYGILPVDRKAGLTLYAILGDWAVILFLLAAIGLSIPGLPGLRKK